MTKELAVTERQNEFLDLYFGECDGVTSRVAKAMGVTPGASYNMARRLSKQIIERTELELAAMAPKAVAVFKQGLEYDPDNEDHAGIQIRMDAAKTLFDKVGIVKKQQIEVKAQVAHSVQFFLPEKDEIVINGESEPA